MLETWRLALRGETNAYLDGALVELSSVSLQLGHGVLVGDTLERRIIAASQAAVVNGLGPFLVGLESLGGDILLQDDDVAVRDRLADFASIEGLLRLGSGQNSGESGSEEGSGFEEVLHLEDRRQETRERRPVRRDNCGVMIRLLMSF